MSRLWWFWGRVYRLSLGNDFSRGQRLCRLRRFPTPFPYACEQISRLGSRNEYPAQERAQLFERNPANEMSFIRVRNRARLLRHNNHNRVGFLAEPNARAMPSAE